jgi:MarR family 2-MHQ and catechol resistance regulon transcriptional repressor
VPTHFPGKETEQRALNALITLRRAANTVSLREAALMRRHGLTESQFGVLEALMHLGPMCQKDLADKILKSSGNLTTVIDNLERAGLVERRRTPNDRRMVTVRLSDAGARLIGRIFPAHVAAIVELFAVLSADEQLELARLCRLLGLQQTAGE